MTIDDCHVEILRALEKAHGRAVVLNGGVMHFSLNPPDPNAQSPLDAIGEALDRSDCWVEVSISEAGIRVLGQNYVLAAGMTVCPAGWNFFPPKECGYSGPTYRELARLDPETVRDALKIFQ